MRFHASAPPGEWINDPNALFFKDGRYWLYAQHAEDGADPKSIGWGAFESEDLTHWRWARRVIAPDGAGQSAYSGSVAMSSQGELVTALTRHDHVSGMQSQQWIGSKVEDIGPNGKDCRDPFIISTEPGARAILIARPCNWHDWKNEAPSHLEIWRERGVGAWQCDGTIGPWSPPGVLWEVPQLFRLGETDVLIVSIVDRRGDAIVSSVRYWFGCFSGHGFDRAPDWPVQGKPLDLGPDFYAAIVNLELSWPDDRRAIVGWASNWAYARRIRLPNGSAGGSISSPRSVSISPCGTRLEQRLVRAAIGLDCDTLQVPNGGSVRIASAHGTIDLLTAGGELAVVVERELLARHEQRAAISAVPVIALKILRDGPLIEVFAEPLGLTATILLPGLLDDTPLAITLNEAAGAY